MLNSDQYIDARFLLALYIRHQRERLNISIEDAAFQSGISYGQWCQLELGEYHPLGQGTLKSIADTLMLSLEECYLFSTLGRTSSARIGTGGAD